MNNKSFIKSFIIIFLFICFCLAAQTDNAVKPQSENWAPNTKNAVDNLIMENAGKKGAYAVFNWENTSIYADVQDNLFIYQIDQLAFKMTPEEFKYSFLHYTDTGYKYNLQISSENFSPKYRNVNGKSINISLIAEDCYDDYKFFYENYRGMNPNSAGNISLEKLRETNQFRDFNAKMWFTYAALENTFSPNVANTWIMYVSYPGFSSLEVRNMVRKAVNIGIKRNNKKVYFDSPVELPGKTGVVSNSAIGNYFVNKIRPIPEIGLLFKKLERNKIPVYISTSSMQDIIEAVATYPAFGYNLQGNRVLGLRLKKDNSGKFISLCNTSDGYAINSMEGKAYNINIILVNRYNANPIMIAGSSQGDYYMIAQFSGLNGVAMLNKYKPVQLILVINRLKGKMIGEICKIAAGQLFGKKTGSSVVVLQGRDENSGAWIPTEKTLKFGSFGLDKLKLLP